MIQEIITYIIVFIAVIYTVVNGIKFFINSSEKTKCGNNSVCSCTATNIDKMKKANL